MNPEPLSDLLARFRRHLLWGTLLRWSLMGGFVSAAVVYSLARPGMQPALLSAMVGLFVLWMVTMAVGLKLVRSTRLGVAMLAMGQPEDAYRALLDAASKFTPLRGAKLLAGHQLAIAAHQTRRYHEAAAVSRLVLEHHTTAWRTLVNTTRLVLADSLLGLDDLEAAEPVLERLDETELGLADRLTLLPIALRWQLATDRTPLAVDALPEKLRLADLMDAGGACLVHLLLAESCRRERRTAAQEYLLRRAHLLADVGPVAARYPDLLGRLVAVESSASPNSPSV